LISTASGRLPPISLNTLCCLPPSTEPWQREIVGTLFSLPGKPQPGVIVLSSSEGGLNEYLAATLASDGFTTLALAYFNFEDCPISYARFRLNTSRELSTGSSNKNCVSPEGREIKLPESGGVFLA
jgi:hypothetical protein